MKAAVLGYGTVGKGVHDMLCASNTLEAGAVLVRAGKADADFKTDSLEAICADKSIDAAAETMGGVDTAYSYAKRVIESGKHFVTSNKVLVAARGIELAALARENNVGFLFSAACGGAVPFLHNLELARENDEIISLGGILNGTTNYMLDMMQSEGLDYEEALRDAQKLGYAEADPTADVSGLDALRKIMLACAVAYDVLPDEGAVCEGIESLRKDDVRDLKARSLTCRLLARGGKNADGSVYAYVQPALLPPDAPECAVKKNFNMARYIGQSSGQIVLMGQGAGRYPTASAVVRDIECLAVGQREMISERCRREKADNSGVLCKFYVRLPSAFAGEMDAESAENENGVTRLITKPMSVEKMHALARSVRRGGGEVFFAELA